MAQGLREALATCGHFPSAAAWEDEAPEFEARVRRALASSSAAAVALERNGWCEVDGLLGPRMAGALVAEVTWLGAKGLVIPNRSYFGGTLVTKPGVAEMDLDVAPVRERVPACGALRLTHAPALAAALADACPFLGLDAARDDAVTVKVQVNDGRGGCFPHHFDNAGPPSRRALTCLCYLNAGWSDGDGGELELLPFLAPGGMPIRVAPTLDHWCMFRSDRVLHRTLPAHKPRLCFTVWIDGVATNAEEDLVLRAPPQGADRAAVETTARQLALGGPQQRAISRALYADAYEQSLREGLAGGDPAVLEACLVTHAKSVADLLRVDGIHELLDALRALALPPPPPPEESACSR